MSGKSHILLREVLGALSKRSPGSFFKDEQTNGKEKTRLCIRMFEPSITGRCSAKQEEGYLIEFLREVLGEWLDAHVEIPKGSLGVP